MNPVAIGMAAARRIAPHDRELDDLAQEAALAVVGVAAAKPGAGLDYLHGVARTRVRNVLGNARRWTGSAPRSASHLDPLRRKETAGLGALAAEPPAPDELERVEWRSLRPELEAAIAEIPGRGGRAVSRDVARALLSGLTVSEAGRVLGIGPDAARAAWRSARARLRLSLAHLEGLVA